MAAVRIGTSGWTYDGWRGPFYPEEVPRNNWLEWYGEQFSTVEVNGSFYRTPSLETVRKWRDDTPAPRAWSDGRIQRSLSAQYAAEMEP
jgi:uncharacterized protein YecE (DUF72 family)